MWYLINVLLFTGICKVCRNDHLAAVRVVNPGENLFTVQSDEPAVAQSDDTAVTQSEVLARAPEGIPEFLSPQPHASSDSGSQLEVCFAFLLCQYDL